MRWLFAVLILVFDLFAIMDMPKFTDERIHFRNSGVKGLMVLTYVITFELLNFDNKAIDIINFVKRFLNLIVNTLNMFRDIQLEYQLL